MKICVFSHTFSRFKNDAAGGAFMDGFCEGLQQEGNKVIVLVPYDVKIHRGDHDQNYKFRYFKYVYPLSLHVLGYSRTLENDRKLKKIVYLLAPLYYFFGFLSLLKLVIKEKIDVINVHWIIPGGFIAAIVSLITGVPLVITVAGSDVYLASKNKLFRFMALFAAKVSKEIVGGGSPLWTEDLVKIGVQKNKTSHTIIYGVDPKKFFPTKKGVNKLKNKLNIRDNAMVVLAVGRLVYKKGMHILINSISNVVEKNKNVKFVIVGDGDQKKELQTLSKELKVNNNLIMPGTILRDELLTYYNMCDIYVSMSIRDKFGNLDDQSIALVEVMACMKPTIATNLAGNRIIVKNNKNGLLFKMGDSKELSEKINFLAENEKIRKKFAETGYKLALNDFSVGAVGKSYTKLFKQIIG